MKKIELRTWVFVFICTALLGRAFADASLADAVESRDSERIQSALSGKVDIDASQVDGMTALHWAAYHDNWKIAKQLLDKGASPVVQNRFGITPLYLACVNGNANLVKALIDLGADANTEVNGGETVLMTASRTGKVDAVVALIDAGADVDATERSGQSAMMWAAAEGHVAVVRALLDAGADFQTPLGKSGYTPFFFSVREGNTQVVRMLLEAGVDVNAVMHLEKSTGKLPKNGTSPLLLAVENGHYDLAIELLDLGADPNDDRSGFTILHTLTWIRKPDIGESANGDPAPHGSGRRNSDQFIREIVKRGADVNARLKRGRKAGRGYVADVGATPFFMAADRADLPYMKLLLELGADPFVPNRDGCTALMVAAGLGSRAPEEEAGSLVECLAVVKFMVALGSEVNVVDANGETAMHGAAYKNAPLVAQYLHEQGADIEIWNTNNDFGWTPLLIAEGYRPGNFKTSFVTVDVITEIMLSQGAKIPIARPKAYNYYGKDPPASDKAKESNLKKL